MAQSPEVDEVAAALFTSVGLLRRRIRQTQAEGELTLPETSALSRLDRYGPASASDMAKVEQISPQSMGATLSGLESRGLIARRPDPDDGRRVVLSLTDAGLALLRERRAAKAELLADALADGFTSQELAQLLAVVPLIERLAQKL